jgi:hypothetical protein
LLLNVLHDRFIGNVTRTGHKIPASPHVPTPKRPTQTLIPHQHLPRRLAFHRLSHLADRELWRHRHKYVHTILRDISPQNLHIVSLTCLTNQISDPLCNLSSQNRLAVLRHLHKVILQVINGMARPSIVLHAASILKSSPKGKAFSPNPRGRQ